MELGRRDADGPRVTWCEEVLSANANGQRPERTLAVGEAKYVLPMVFPLANPARILSVVIPLARRLKSTLQFR